MRRILRIAGWTLAGLTALVLLLVIAGLVTIQTSWFREKVRQRIVYEIENATGGRVELGAFLFEPRALTAEVRNLVIRGTEAPPEEPLFRAESVRVGLRIISVFRREVDIYSLVVTRPQANVIVYDDGRTNVPRPKRVSPRKRDPIQTVLDLAIKRFNITDGTVRFAMKRMPLNVVGEDFRALIRYDRTAGDIPAPRYTGDVSFRNLAVKPGEVKTLPLDVKAQFALAQNVLDIRSVHIGLNDSTIDLRGRLRDFRSPALRMQYAAHISMQDIAPLVGVSALPSRGKADIGGEVTLFGPEGFGLGGRLRAGGLAFEQRGIRITDVRMESDVAVTQERIRLAGLTVLALGGRFDGSAVFEKFRDFRVEGNAQGFSIHELTHIQGIEHADWNGSVSGPLTLTGAIRNGKLADLDLAGRFDIAPEAGQNPVEGVVDVNYDRGRGALTFGPSHLATKLSRLQFSGTLGRVLTIDAQSTNLDDIEPAIQMARGKPYDLPVTLLPHGNARYVGTVTGPLKEPVAQGRVSLANFVVAERTVDSLTADIRAEKTGVNARNVDARRGKMRLTGNAQVALRNWRPEDQMPLSGAFVLNSPDIEAVLKELNQSLPVTSGPVSAQFALGGTIETPQLDGHAEAVKVVAYGEQVASAAADFRFREGLLELSPATAQVAGTQVRLAGSYEYAKGAARTGRVKFDLATKALQLARLKNIQSRQQGLGGAVEARLSGDVTLEKAGFRINSVNGTAAVRNLVVDTEQLGSLDVSARTEGAKATVQVSGELAGSKLKGVTDWTLSGDYPVSGDFEFTPINFATLIERFRNMPPGNGLPFDGYAGGQVKFTGLTTRPETFKGTAEITDFLVRPVRRVVHPANADQLAIHNAGPILIDLDSKTARVRQAAFKGRNTDVTVAGRISFLSRNPFDLRVRGQMNLAVLRDFEPRLYSSGGLLLDVSVRGRPARPDVYGTVNLKDAAFNWPGFPNGIDNANGLIFLYRDRASIERITAQTGGGRLVTNGFVSFDPTLRFHLETRAENVRVRYPEGVSSTADANLTLSGGAERSLLSGDVTVTRLGFNPRSDLASILASTAEPVQTPAEPNEFLQGMRLDVHIQTSPQVRLETKLTRDVQADADLRLRGNPTRPVLLGRVTVNEGEVLFFGNQYNIESGQVLFVNASKIEPIVNLDLQTRARGIDVILHVSGPVNKLNVTYRSDPPLQFSEIVALLATGRDPLGTGLAASQAQTNQSWQQAGASALLGQALANPIAGRLQRFFGVSRLKIDPQITGTTTNAAAARVTLEQQITRNITLTYITDLSRPQAQVIRIEVDLTRNWSGVAIREENGLFGVDVLYRKQFK